MAERHRLFRRLGLLEFESRNMPAGINSPPVNQLPATIDALEDTQLTLSGVRAWDPDAGSGAIQVTFEVPVWAGTFRVRDDVPGGLFNTEIVGQNSHRVSVSAPLDRIDATLTTGGVFWAPAPDVSGDVLLTMTTDDLGNTGEGGAQTDTDTATIRVASINDAPTLDPIPNPPAIDEDAGEQLILLTAITPGLAVNEAGQQVSVSASAADPSFFSSLVITGSGSSRELRYVPSPNAFGQTILQVTATDDGGVAAGGIDRLSVSFRVIINPVNDRPILNDRSLAYAGNMGIGAIIGTLRATDADPGDGLSYQIDSGNEAGAFAIDSLTGKLTVADTVPLGGGNFSLVVRVTDDGVGSLSDTATITIIADQPPEIAGAGIADLVVNEDADPIQVDLAGFFNDESPLAFSTESNSPQLLETKIEGSRLVLRPRGNQSGKATVTIRATDAFGQAVSDSFDVVVNPVNDAPTLDTATAVILGLFPAGTNGWAGAPIAALTGGINDVDANNLKGVAIIGAAAGWQFSLDAGETWREITGVGDRRGLMLADRPEHRVRFQTKPGFNGFASLRYKAWDQTTGISGEVADTTFGSSFGIAIEKATAAVGKTIPRIDANGIPQLTSIERDEANPPGDLVRNLVAGLVADADSPNGSGIAITAADTSHGRWQFLIGKTWRDFGAVSPANALLLGPGTKIRFVPDRGFSGMAGLFFHAWDLSAGETGERADIAGRHFSLSGINAQIQVTARPALDVSLPRILATAASKISVADLLKDAVSDLPNGASAGLVVTAVSGKGVWSYQIGSGPAVPITAGVKTALLLPADAMIGFTPKGDFTGRATLSYRAWNRQTLPATPGNRADSGGPAFSREIETLTIDAVPAAGNSRPVIKNSTINLGSLPEDPKTNPGRTVRSLVIAGQLTDDRSANSIGIAITGSVETVGNWQFSLDGKTWAGIGARTVTDALLLPPTARIRLAPASNASGSASLSFKAWDGAFAWAGDRVDTMVGDSFSLAIGTATLAITSVNDPPVLDNSGMKFLPFIGAGAESSVIQVTSLLAGASDLETARADLGIAITTTVGPGKWQFSTDGLAFFSLPKLPALLPANARLRFKGDPGRSGMAALTYRAWDGSTGFILPLKPDALSAASETLTIAVGNTSPTLNGPGRLSPITEDPAPNPGDTVAGILGATFRDTPGARRGFAVIGASTPIEGQWQYSLNAGKSWRPINGPEATRALLLPESARVRFVPGRDQFSTPGAEPALTYKAWDQTVGQAGDLVDTTDAGLDSFSSAVTATITVNSMIDPPALDTGRLLLVDAPVAVANLLAGITIPANNATWGISVVSMTGQGSWQIDSGTGYKDIATLPVAQRLFNPSAVIRFVPKHGFTGSATLRFKAWDPAGGPGRVSREVETLAWSAGNQRPVLEGF